MKDNQPLINYLDTVKTKNLTDIAILEQTIATIEDSITQMEQVIIAYQQQEGDTNDQIDTLTNANITLDLIIAILT